ncbi:nuclear transport factor 2 family protein [Rhodococcus chondri]|uniref:Nuclear transport factor 2 family protein n=1 Tax=Rhodococcus chondri TaxID=3065941 RepID=A0ABU7JKR1_9NOCA|nr:nuclear transport factor 2 family protein [Rhodococcus sp. CC-R104]MEE2030626.1 nuclear transport factor 2 family protein [Rhodococcus sp. CC-R104]
MADQEKTGSSGHSTDAFEIGQLVARYALAIDDHDTDALAEMYVPDAEFIGLSDTPQGRSEIVRYVREALTGYDAVSVHTPHSSVVDFADDDTAYGIVPCHVEFAQDGVQMILAVRYYDRYVRHDGRWRFGSRRLEVRYASPVDGYSTVLTTAPARL